MAGNAHRLSRLLAVLVVLVTMLVPGLRVVSAADVVGNTYTSPTYGYSISWNSSWFVAEESSEGFFDHLALTNGSAFVSLYGEISPFPPAFQLSSFEISMKADPQVSNFYVQTDAAGNELKSVADDHAFASYAYTLTYEDGFVVDVGMFIDARPIVPGESMVSMYAQSRLSDFNYMKGEFDALLATLVVPETETVPETVVGEPAPVFVTGPWRVGVARVAQAAALPDAGLAEKSGKEWMVVVLDIGNWSAAPAEINLRDFKVVPDGSGKPVKVAPASTQSIADNLGTTAIGDELKLTIKTGESARVSLSFSVPASPQDYSLTIGNVIIPLDELMELTLSRAELPPVALPAEVVPAEIVSASDGKTMRVLLDGETDSRRIQLAGVEPPTEGDCYKNDAENILDGLAGIRVLVEGDSEVTGGKIPVRYVWLINPDGTRTLLNQSMLAQGVARAGTLPGTARFGLWLSTTAQTAEADGIGLWGGCETPVVDTDKATPVDE